VGATVTADVAAVAVEAVVFDATAAVANATAIGDTATAIIVNVAVNAAWSSGIACEHKSSLYTWVGDMKGMTNIQKDNGRYVCQRNTQAIFLECRYSESD
jgi:hypothetical protein